MAKGVYHLQEGPLEKAEPNNRVDNSFKSCICILLVVLAICIIVLLVGLPWKKFGNNDHYSQEEETGEFKNSVNSEERTEPTKFLTTLIYSSTRSTISGKTRPDIQNTHSSNDHTTIYTKPSEKQTDKSNYFDTQYTIPYEPQEETKKENGNQDLSTKTSLDDLELKTTAFVYTTRVNNSTSKGWTKNPSPKPNAESTTSYPEKSTHARTSTENTKSTGIYTDYGYFTTRSSNSTTTKKEGTISTIEQTIITVPTSKPSTQYSTQSTVSILSTLKTAANYTEESFNDSSGTTLDSSTLYSKIFNYIASTTNAESYYTQYDSIQNFSTDSPMEHLTSPEDGITNSSEKAENKSSTFNQYSSTRSTESPNITEFTYFTTELRNYSSDSDQNITTTFEAKVTTESYNTSTQLHTTTNTINETSTIKPSTISFTTNADEKTTNTPVFTTTEAVVNKSSNIQSLPNITSRVLNLGNSPRICTTSECNSAASQMLVKMNHSTDACEDFYDFSCGAMQGGLTDEDAENDFVIQKLMEDDASDELFLEVFKKFYASCVKHEVQFIYKERIAELKKLVGYLGNFDDGKNTQNFQINMTYFISQLLLRQSFPLFEVGMDLDKQTKSYILQLILPRESSLPSGYREWSALLSNRRRCLNQQRHKIYGSYLNLTEIHDSYLECQKNYSVYLNSVESALRAIAVFSHLQEVEVLQQIKDIRFVIEEILNLTKNLPSPIEVREQLVNRNYKILKVSDLQIHYGFLDWSYLFSTLTGGSINNDTTVQVYFCDYMAKLFTGISRIKKRKLYNTFLSIYTYDLYVNFVVPKQKNNREQFCLKQASSLLPDVHAYIYYDIKSRYYKKQASILERYFSDLKKTFANSVKNVDWLDDKARISILKKASEISLIFNENMSTAVDKFILHARYDDLDLSEDSYGTNLEIILARSRSLFYSLYKETFTEEHIFKYFLRSYSKDPLTFYTDRFIAVPDGLLGQISTDLPEYLMMTGPVFRIAREFGRHFDPVGIKNGITLSQTSSATYKDLVETTKEMLKYASPRNYRYQNVSFTLKGIVSTNLRIAENLAFRLILDTMNTRLHSQQEPLLPWISSTYSKEKVLFIATAQQYCKKSSILEYMLQIFESDRIPESMRVENLMSNSQSFVDVFECGDGAGMNNIPIKKYQLPDLLKAEEDYYYNSS